MKPKHEKLSLFKRLLRTALLLSLLAVVSVSAAIGLYLYRAGGLLAVLEDRLSRPDLGVDVAIGDVSWALQWSVTPLVVDLKEVDIKAGAQMFQVSNAAMYFGGRSLSTGGQPEVLIVKGLDVKLVHGHDGWGVQDNIQGFDARLDFQTLADQLQDITPDIGLRQILLQSSHIEILDTTSAALQPLQFSDTAILLDISDLTQMKANLRARQSQNAEANASDDLSSAGTVAIDLEGDLLSGFWKTRMTSDALQLAPLQAAAPILFPTLSTDTYIQFGQDSYLTGEGVATFDGTQMQTASLTVDVNDASLQIDAFSAEEGRFDSLGLAAAYSFADKLVTISRAEIELPDKRRLSMNGQLLNLDGDSVGLSGTLLAQNVSLKSILDDWPKTAAPAIREQLETSFSAGRFSSLLLSFAGDYERENAALSLSNLSGKGAFEGVRLNAKFNQYRSIVGTLAGKVDVSLGADGIVESALVEAMMDSGFLILDGLDKPVQIPKAGVNASFQPGTIFIETLFADFAERGEMTANATIDFTEDLAGGFAVSSSVFSDQMDVELFENLWPNQVAKTTINWVRKRINDGQLVDVTMRMQGAKKPGDKLRITDMTGQGQLVDTRVTWVDGSPQVDGVNAGLTILNNQFDVLVSQGQIGDLEINDGQITIDPLVAPQGTPRNLQIGFSGGGSFVDMVGLVGHPTVRPLPDAIDLLAFEDGDATASVKVKSILANGQLSDTQVQAEGFVAATQISNLPYGTSLIDPKISISVVNETTQIDGSGQLLDIPLQFQLLTGNSEDILMQVDIPNTERVNTLLTAATGQTIAGSSSAQLQMKFRPGQDDLKLDIAANLETSSLDIPLLNFAKLPGEVGDVSFSLITKQGRLASLDNIDIRLGSLLATGTLGFGAENDIKSGTFENVSLPGYELEHLAFQRQDAGDIDLNVRAKRIDLSPLLRGSDDIETAPILRFDISGDKLQVNNSIFLSGHLSGSVGGAGDGTAKLLGDISIDGEPLITEATVDAVLGDEHPVIDAVGLIGGAEARLSFSTSENSKPVLVVSSPKAGRVLRGLGITDTIRGGHMRLVNEFTNADLTDYDTVIQLEDFNVIEAPAAVRAFSVLSVGGLYSLVEGDGTRFTMGEGRIKKRGDLLEFEVLKATGGAVGVYMVGNYNRASGEVDVSGNLVPVNQFSKILGIVPVLGELLTGLDKSGLFATQFSLTGAIEDPVVQVNPSSLIAPGLLRDLFSPNWLASEGERILTQDNASQ